MERGCLIIEFFSDAVPQNFRRYAVVIEQSSWKSRSLEGFLFHSGNPILLQEGPSFALALFALPGGQVMEALIMHGHTVFEQEDW